MKQKQAIILDSVMAECVKAELKHAGVDYEEEFRVLENGECITCIYYDPSEPYVANFFFSAGAKYYRNTIINLNNQL